MKTNENQQKSLEKQRETNENQSHHMHTHEESTHPYEPNPPSYFFQKFESFHDFFMKIWCAYVNKRDLICMWLKFGGLIPKIEENIFFLSSYSTASRLVPETISSLASPRPKFLKKIFRLRWSHPHPDLSQQPRALCVYIAKSQISTFPEVIWGFISNQPLMSVGCLQIFVGIGPADFHQTWLTCCAGLFVESNTWQQNGNSTLCVSISFCCGP